MDEIEIRGKLAKSDFERIFSFLDKEGKLQNHYHRLSVDLSPGFNPKTRKWAETDKLDLRVKKSDKAEMISLKIGGFHLKKRREIEVELKSGEFLNAVALIEALGFNKGMVYFWESWEFKYQGFEVKLSRYTDDYYTWEIEAGSKDPNLLAKLLKISPWSKNECDEAINWQNQNIHQLYSKRSAEGILKIHF